MERLAPRRFGARRRPPKTKTRALREVDALAEDHEVALDAVEHGDARQVSSALEAELVAEGEAPRVVREDEAEQGGDAEVGRSLDRADQEFARDALKRAGVPSAARASADAEID